MPRKPAFIYCDLISASGLLVDAWAKDISFQSIQIRDEDDAKKKCNTSTLDYMARIEADAGDAQNNSKKRDIIALLRWRENNL